MPVDQNFTRLIIGTSRKTLAFCSIFKFHSELSDPGVGKAAIPPARLARRQTLKRTVDAPQKMQAFLGFLAKAHALRLSS
jgi:hypothetical protein